MTFIMNDYESWSPRVSSFPPRVLYFFSPRSVRIACFLFKLQFLLQSGAAFKLRRLWGGGGGGDAWGRNLYFLKVAAAIDVRVNPLWAVSHSLLAYNESLIGCCGRSPAVSQSRIKSRSGEAGGEQKELGSLWVFSFSAAFNPTAPAFLDDGAALADPRFVYFLLIIPRPDISRLETHKWFVVCTLFCFLSFIRFCMKWCPDKWCDLREKLLPSRETFTLSVFWLAYIVIFHRNLLIWKLCHSLHVPQTIFTAVI